MFTNRMITIKLTIEVLSLLKVIHCLYLLFQIIMSIVAAVAGLAALNYFTLQNQLNNIDSTTSICQAVMQSNISYKIFYY